MTRFINDIADILPGTFQKVSSQGKVAFLQVSHFDTDEQLLPQQLVYVEYRRTIERHLLQPGDILLAAKGGRNFAVLYDPSIGPAIASTAFLVLRLTAADVLPEYAAVYLNLQRSTLAGLASGTSMSSISKQTLSMFSIAVPSAERQQEIVAISRLWHREKTLLQRIIEEKTSFYTQLLVQIAEPSHQRI